MDVDAASTYWNRASALLKAEPNNGLSICGGVMTRPAELFNFSLKLLFSCNICWKFTTFSFKWFPGEFPVAVGPLAPPLLPFEALLLFPCCWRWHICCWWPCRLFMMSTVPLFPVVSAGEATPFMLCCVCRSPADWPLRTVPPPLPFAFPCFRFRFLSWVGDGTSCLNAPRLW